MRAHRIALGIAPTIVNCFWEERPSGLSVAGYSGLQRMITAQERKAVRELAAIGRAAEHLDEVVALVEDVEAVARYSTGPRVGSLRSKTTLRPRMILLSSMTCRFVERTVRRKVSLRPLGTRPGQAASLAEEDITLARADKMRPRGLPTWNVADRAGEVSRTAGRRSA